MSVVVPHSDIRTFRAQVKDEMVTIRTRDLARMWGTSTPFVSKMKTTDRLPNDDHVKALGWKRTTVIRKNGVRVSREAVDAAIARRIRGMSVCAVARELGISHHRAYSLMTGRPVIDVYATYVAAGYQVVHHYSRRDA